ncbi:MAG: NAD-dependent epimerase/dehydratase family protein [Oligoflexia bacterium]|nr:NAD-dependent epimerase/dehydratase family protein [Oligoflexia bacterium]
MNADKKLSKVLVTGASGLVGSHVMEFFQSHNIEVFALVRKSSDLKFLKSIGAKLIEGDIADLEGLTKIFAEFDSIIHVAAKVGDWGELSDFYKTNVKGTLNVLKACHTNKIKNIILTGSISSYGEEDYSGKKDESYPNNSHYDYFLDKVFPCKMNYYRDTKAMMTKKSEEFFNEISITDPDYAKNLSIVVIEPCWVFGEREFHSGFYDYIKSVKDGMPFVFGGKGNLFHVIYAPELARAYYLAYQKQLNKEKDKDKDKDITGFHRIIVGDENICEMDIVLKLFCEKAGLKRPKRAPKAVAYALGFSLEFFYTACKIKIPPLLTRGRVNMFYDNIEYSVAKANKLLNFKIEVGLREGIIRTVKWYKDNGLI